MLIVMVEDVMTEIKSQPNLQSYSEGKDYSQYTVEGILDWFSLTI